MSGQIVVDADEVEHFIVGREYRWVANLPNGQVVLEHDE